MDELSGEVTSWLLAWGGGDALALERLIALVYPDLRRLARALLRRERDDHSLHTGDLVNETYLRLCRQRQAAGQDRGQFLAFCARLMRRILVDHARRRRCQRHAGEARKVPLEAAALVGDGRTAEVLAVHGALDVLEGVDERKARIVELRFFGGLTIEEAAEALGCSHATIEREWRLARAWLVRELRRARPGAGA